MSIPGSMLLLLLAIIIGAISYLGYVHRIGSILRKTTDSSFGSNDLMKALHLPQGSNFNTVIIFSWSLFLVALVFLYFLTPEFFPEWNYFNNQEMASSDFGFAIVGILILLSSLVLSLTVPRIYSSYLISRWLKNLNLLVPILLIISICCSFFLGTIYPLTNRFIWNMGYGAIFIALVFLMLPIVMGFVEELRI